MSVTSLACPRVQTLVPYQSARRIGGRGHVFLNANEAPDCGEYTLDDATLNRYPECQPPEVINAYADYAGVTPEQVLVSRGSDEAIELLIRAFCEPGKDKILICPPTYGMYAISAETIGVDVEIVPPDANFQPDVDAILARSAGVKVMFFCSPNNPTGTLLERARLRALLDAIQNRCIVVVDEAYIEFCQDDSFVDLLAQYPNLVVTRTLSKAFALAGIRCGFTLASAEIIQILLKVIAPYPIAAPVAQIAAQALNAKGLARMTQRVGKLNQLKAALKLQLQELAYVREIFEDYGNFLLIRFDDSKTVFQAMVDAGIILRDFASKPGLANCIRITIGSQAELTEVVKVLQALNAAQPVQKEEK